MDDSPTLLKIHPIHGRDLGTQLFVGQRPDPVLVVPAAFDPVRAVVNKPSGGFWTSTYRQGSSGWVDWCRGEDWGGVDGADWWLLTPRPDTLLIEIDSADDFATTLMVYGRKLSDRLYHDASILDFDAMIRDGYDGLHLTVRGALECHYGSFFTMSSLNAWDCESTVFFHWCFTDVVQTERNEYTKEHDPYDDADYSGDW